MSNIPGSAHVNFILGGLFIVGGAMSYLRKGSKPPLIGGLTFGGLLVGSGVLIVQDEHYKGHALAASLMGMMALVMGQKFWKTGKSMAAVVGSAGAVGCAYNLKKALEWAVV